MFVVWSFLMSGLLLCVMFIPDGDWVSWLNFKPPPSWEYMGVILILGVSGGLVCYCWEVIIQPHNLKEVIHGLCIAEVFGSRTDVPVAVAQV